MRTPAGDPAQRVQVAARLREDGDLAAHAVDGRELQVREDRARRLVPAAGGQRRVLVIYSGGAGAGTHVVATTSPHGFTTVEWPHACGRGRRGGDGCEPPAPLLRWGGGCKQPPGMQSRPGCGLGWLCTRSTARPAHVLAARRGGGGKTQ